MRLMVSIVFNVCRVVKTKCPVSAAVRAMDMVSKSRISPIKITSGSCRKACLKAVPKDSVSPPTSLWLMIDFLSL